MNESETDHSESTERWELNRELVSVPMQTNEP